MFSKRLTNDRRHVDIASDAARKNTLATFGYKDGAPLALERKFVAFLNLTALRSRPYTFDMRTTGQQPALDVGWRILAEVGMW
jgi:hypothetical protein